MKRHSTKKAARKKPARNADGEMDIIDVILEDHKPLWDLIEIMKDDDKSLRERKAAFDEFAPTLAAHAKPEERSLYQFMKGKDDLGEEAFEGEVEHGLADQLVEEVKRTTEEDVLGARIKVLAELVEHHLEEEEEEIFPHVRGQTSATERSHLADEYLMYQQEVEATDLDAQPAPKKQAPTHQPHAP